MRGWQSAQRSLIRGRGILLQRAFTTSVPQCGGKTVAHQIDCKVDTEEVSVKGWVRSVRKQKRVAFAAVSDGSTLESLQAVLRPDDAVGYEIQLHYVDNGLIETGYRQVQLSI